jgi:hypothetical protein
MVTSATQPEHNMILSSPVQKHESNPELKDNKACCLDIVINLSIVDSRIYMLLLVRFVSRTWLHVCASRAWTWMVHGKTKTRLTAATTATAKIIVCFIEASIQGPQWLPRGLQKQRQVMPVTMMTATRTTRIAIT